MAEISKTAKLTVRLLIDKERNEVVLAESGKDFVDVLFSFLTLPMGTIIRLLEKHRKPSHETVVGCFNNLYKSVSEMDLESFQTETCKQLLLYPRSVKHDKYSKIKLKIDDTDTEALKYFVCPGFEYSQICRSCYSISNIEECVCGEIVNREIQGLEEEQVKGKIPRNDKDGVFVSCKTTSSFIITDDLKVVPSTMDYALDTLKSLGYSDANKLGEIFLDVGLSEVITLLECFFTSDSPLTDIVLRKQSSLHMTRPRIPLSPIVQRSGGQTITLKAFSRKVDSKLLCVESGADFIDLLFSFLALPLETVWKFSGDNISLGCIGNLFRSYKSLNEASTSSSKSLLPSYYSCPKQLLDVVTEQEEIYYSFRDDGGEIYDCKFSRKIPDCLNSRYENTFDEIEWTHPEDARVLLRKSFGFVKSSASFLVTDDLVITPVSNISFLKLKIQLEKDDIEEHFVTIGKPQAIHLLRASVMTSSPLTSCFWNSIAKKVKEEI